MAAKSKSVLTPRQLEVLVLYASGMTGGQIAALLFISSKTVNRHAECIHQRLGSRTLPQAVHIAHMRGIMTGDHDGPAVT